MYIVSGTITVDPSDHDAAVACFDAVTAATLNEDGNTTYGFWASTSDPGVFRVYEEWASLDAIGAHMASPHMAEFLGSMAALRITGTEITQHEVAGSSKLM